jgi:hypothetical protein
VIRIGAAGTVVAHSALTEAGVDFAGPGLLVLATPKADTSTVGGFGAATASLERGQRFSATPCSVDHDAGSQNFGLWSMLHHGGW